MDTCLGRPVTALKRYHSNCTSKKRFGQPVLPPNARGVHDVHVQCNGQSLPFMVHFSATTPAQEVEYGLELGGTITIDLQNRSLGECSRGPGDGCKMM